MVVYLILKLVYLKNLEQIQKKYIYEEHYFFTFPCVLKESRSGWCQYHDFVCVALLSMIKSKVSSIAEGQLHPFQCPCRPQDPEAQSAGQLACCHAHLLDRLKSCLKPGNIKRET